MYHMNHYSMKTLTLYSLAVVLFSFARHSPFKLTYPLIEFNLFHSACKTDLQFSPAFPRQAWRAFHLFFCLPQLCVLTILHRRLLPPLQPCSSHCFSIPALSWICQMSYLNPSNTREEEDFVLLGTRTFTRFSLEARLNSLVCVADEGQLGRW